MPVKLKDYVNSLNHWKNMSVRVRAKHSATLVQKRLHILWALSKSFSPDNRSLAAFRVVLAVGLLLDLIQRYLNASHFYSESGVLPHTLWKTLFGDQPYYWSLHFLNGSEVLFKALLLFQICLALCLLVGYRTRLASFLSWILMLSLVLRNPLLFYGGDKLAPLLLLIATLLPLSMRDVVKKSASLIVNLSFFWLMMQMAILYIASGVSKLDSVYWQDGTALTNVLLTPSKLQPHIAS